MADATDCVTCWSELKLIEDDDLDEILRLADSIRAVNPIYDDDIDLTLLDTQSSATAELGPGNCLF